MIYFFQEVFIVKENFFKLKEEKPEYSLDQLLYHTYLQMKTELPFEEVKEKILEDAGIDEMEYYLRDVGAKLREYVEKNVWPYWDLNDKGHGPIHRMEVTRRVFALNETFHLGLNPDMLYAIANWHDVGKYVDVKLTNSSVTVFYKSNQICSHKRLYGRVNQYSTEESHMPENHQLFQWNENRFIDWSIKLAHIQMLS